METVPSVIKRPSLLRNYISFVGGAIVIAALTSIVLLFLIEITSNGENPYLGILLGRLQDLQAEPPFQAVGQRPTQDRGIIKRCG